VTQNMVDRCRATLPQLNEFTKRAGACGRAWRWAGSQRVRESEGKGAHDGRLAQRIRRR
jgi:hypothetical protein